MNPSIYFLTTTILFFGATPRLYPQGYIVPGGVTAGGYSPSFGSTINVLQNPTNGSYTGFSLRFEGGDSFSFWPFADEGVRVFFVSSNQPVALPPILAQSYVELGHPAVDCLFQDGIPFYLGLFTGDEYPQNGFYPNPLFGWAQLVNNGGVIDLLDSALTFGADGIYAGTQTIIQPVPEPGAFSLVALGLLGLGWLNRRQSSL